MNADKGEQRGTRIKADEHGWQATEPQGEGSKNRAFTFLFLIRVHPCRSVSPLSVCRSSVVSVVPVVPSW